MMDPVLDRNGMAQTACTPGLYSFEPVARRKSAISTWEISIPEIRARNARIRKAGTPQY